MTEHIRAPGFLLQDAPRTYSVALPGKWLAKQSTTRWRLDDPDNGFQRVVNTARAKKIAVAVLDQRRSFPNSVVLATNAKDFQRDGCFILVPANAKFFVVDGQHRVFAQTFSEYEASYSCIIHMNLTPPDMASIFLEINDNQKRVSSSLRWDLLRLVRPDEERQRYKVSAADLINARATDRSSALYQRIDLSGDVKQISLKQGSIAPEIERLIKSDLLRDIGEDAHYALIASFFSALRSLDSRRWDDGESPLYDARVIKALLALLPSVLNRIGKPPANVRPHDLRSQLDSINLDSLATPDVVAARGNPGTKRIRELLARQLKPKARNS